MRWVCRSLLDSVKRVLDGAAGERRVLSLSSVAAAAALERAGLSCSCCDGSVDYVRQACVAMRWSRWERACLRVLGGKVVGAVGGRDLASLSAVACSGSGSIGLL